MNQLQANKTALTGIPETKVKHFAEEAMTLDAARMKQMESAKRYTLVLALLGVRYVRTLNDLAEMFIKLMQQMHQKGKTALVEYRVQTQSHYYCRSLQVPSDLGAYLLVRYLQQELGVNCT
ncbi:MAG: hypothetical protein LH647_04700, partial [Leptolyngbyaceae cyanobacterium CAN_BIN12]|nr:hypothetical protein [Leptolyngbyaceae cyanobacterium CAN_BIN12]